MRKAKPRTTTKSGMPEQAEDASMMPLPPGIVYWRKARIRTSDDATLDTWLPVERPLAAIRRAELKDADIIALLRQLTLEARTRKISATAVVDAAMGETLRATHRLAARARKPRRGERVTVG
jgi:hypothetical protein